MSQPNQSNAETLAAENARLRRETTALAGTNGAILRENAEMLKVIAATRGGRGAGARIAEQIARSSNMRRDYSESVEEAFREKMAHREEHRDILAALCDITTVIRDEMEGTPGATRLLANLDPAGARARAIARSTE